jgi:hypothetical protein
MNYSADKLATIIGCTVSDIMDINRKILFEQIKTQYPHNLTTLQLQIMIIV